MKALVTGNEGSGKTYHIVSQVIIPEFLKKRKIITNIPLNLEIISAVYGVSAYDYIKYYDADYSDINTYLDNDGNVVEDILYIIDEAQEHFSKIMIEESKVLQLFSRHRKYGIDFYIITQDKSLIYRNITFEVGLYFSKRRSLGLGGYVCKYHTGKSNRSKPISVTDYEYDDRYFPFYQSYAHEGIVEKSNVTGPWWGKVLIILYKKKLYIVLGLMSFAFLSAFSSHNKKPIIEPAKQEQSKPVISENTISVLDKEKPKQDDKPKISPKPKKQNSGYSLYMLSVVDRQIASCWLKRPLSQSEENIEQDKSDDDGKDSSTPFIDLPKPNVMSSNQSQPTYEKVRCESVGAVYVSSRSVQLPSGEILRF